MVLISILSAKNIVLNMTFLNRLTGTVINLTVMNIIVQNQRQNVSISI